MNCVFIFIRFVTKVKWVGPLAAMVRKWKRLHNINVYIYIQACFCVVCSQTPRQSEVGKKKVKLIPNTQKVSGAYVYIKNDIETL